MIKLTILAVMISFALIRVDLALSVVAEPFAAGAIGAKGAKGAAGTVGALVVVVVPLVEE